MNVLHVIASMDPRQGGVGQAVRTLVEGLAAQGIRSEVVSLDAPGPAAGWQEESAFPLHALGPGRGPWHYSGRLLPWLLEHLPRFEAVVLHGLWLYTGYAVRKALARLRARPLAPLLGPPALLVMPHGMLDPYFQRAAGRQLKAWRNRLYWQLVEKGVVNDAAGVLFTCETERQLARQPFAPYRPQREMVVGLGVAEPPPNGPALQAAFHAACPGLGHRPYLLFLGRLDEKKGVELLVRAYARLSSSGGTDARPALVLAGPGLETAYGQRLQRLVADLLPPAACFFPGMLAGAAKWGAFYGCEAFVLPSHQENFGIAVVEALACASPVLISNQVNIWREIEAAGGGLIAADTLPGTLHLLDAWGRLSAAEKQGFRARARAAYSQYFALEPVARHLAGAIRQLSEPRSAGRHRLAS